MVLLSFMLLNKCNYFKKIETKEVYNKYMLNNFLKYIILSVLLFISMFPAIIIAYSTTTGYNRILHLIIGFLFSDLYLCYYVINRFL